MQVFELSEDQKTSWEWLCCLCQVESEKYFMIVSAVTMSKLFMGTAQVVVFGHWMMERESFMYHISLLFEEYLTPEE